MRDFTEEEVETIISLYKTGAKVSEIATKAHCRASTISGVLKSHDVAVKRARISSFGLREDYFDAIDTAQKAYYLGLIFTDGSVTPDKCGRSTSIRIELTDSDYGVLYMLRDELNVTNNITHNKREGRKNGTFSFSIRSEKLAASLATYGIIQNKTYLTDKLPTVPNEFVKPFIHGLVDGDGSIYFSKGSWHINFCSHSKQICEDFKRICNEAIGRTKKLSIQESNGVYRVTYNGPWAKELARTCLNDGMGIKRKQALVEQMLKDVDEDIVHSTAKAVV